MQHLRQKLPQKHKIQKIGVSEALVDAKFIKNVYKMLFFQKMQK